MIKINFPLCGIKKTQLLYSKAGFSLIEMLIVLVIVGVLVGLAIPNFDKIRRTSFEREAQQALRLVQAAEKVFFVKMGRYYPNAGIAYVDDLNADLHLDLSDNNWVYAVTASSLTDFTATASRTGYATWSITKDRDPF